MAHIVFVTGGATGLFNASLALIEQLQQAGHQVAYASSGNLQAPLTALGIPYVPLKPWVMPSEAKSPGSRWAQWRQVRVCQQQAIAAWNMDHFTQTVRSLNPDLLLVDIEMHPQTLAAAMSPYPVALLCPFISIWNRTHLPPIHTGTLPGEGWRGQWWGMQWSWLRYGWRKWKEHQRDRWQQTGLDRISLLRCYARQINYPFRARSGFTQWLVPYPHRALPILCLHAQELDFPHNPHPSMHYLGPMVAESRAEDGASSTADGSKSALEAFLKNRSGRSLIYCGCSSFSTASPSFLRQLRAIAARCHEWDFVIGLADSPYPGSPEALPTNLCVLQWAPQLQILKQADCAIINGGAHSITECIHFGVPMLVFPLPRDDQNGNAARVVYHGLGIASRLEQARPVQIQQHLQSLLTDQSYRTKVNQMRSQFQRCVREKEPVRVVEALLSDSTSKTDSRHRQRKLTQEKAAS